MPKILANGLEFHYQTRGQGPDVVLLHGVTSSLALWYNGVLPQLSEKFRVTAYDLRGHGLTDLTPSGYTSRDMAEDLRCLLDSLEIDDVLLVGHSFGGSIALHFALLYPERVRGVVMLDSGLACLRHLRIIREWQGWENYSAEMSNHGFSLDLFLELDSNQDATEILRRGLVAPRRAGFKKGQSGMTPRLQRLIEETRIGYEFRDVAGMTEDLLAGLTTPVLAVYGETSPFKKMAERLAEILPNCSQMVLPGMGHFYAVHGPEIVTQAILPFLSDRVASLSAADP
jgi:pimeloyl-ACP methyl ester carboxylesterase